MITYPVLTEHMNEPSAAVFIALSTRALVTSYPFCLKMRSLKTLKWFARQYGDRSVILDSGLFTFFKDAGSGRFTKAWCDSYFANYKRVIEVVPAHWIPIELDVHVLDIAVQTYRDWYKESAPDRVLHVWHPRDSVAAIRDYYANFRRVAFSAGASNPDAEKMLAFVKKSHALRKTNKVHTHLLACAGDRFIRTLDDSFSGDASTWNSASLYGSFKNGYNSITYKNGKLTMPGWIEETIHKAMPRMIDLYKSHPEHGGKRAVRVEYIRQMAAGLLAFQDHKDRVRKLHPSYRPGVIEPMDFWRSNGKEKQHSPQN